MDKNIRASRSKILNAFLEIPEYSLSILKKKKFKRRHYIGIAAFQNGEIDLGFLPAYNKWVGFIALQGGLKIMAPLAYKFDRFLIILGKSNEVIKDWLGLDSAFAIFRVPGYEHSS